MTPGSTRTLCMHRYSHKPCVHRYSHKPCVHRYSHKPCVHRYSHKPCVHRYTALTWCVAHVSLLTHCVCFAHRCSGLRDLGLQLSRALAHSPLTRLKPPHDHQLPWISSRDPLVYSAAPFRYSAAIAPLHLRLLPSLLEEYAHGGSTPRLAAFSPSTAAFSPSTSRLRHRSSSPPLLPPLSPGSPPTLPSSRSRRGRRCFNSSCRGSRPQPRASPQRARPPPRPPPPPPQHPPPPPSPPPPPPPPWRPTLRHQQQTRPHSTKPCPF